MKLSLSRTYGYPLKLAMGVLIATLSPSLFAKANVVHWQDQIPSALAPFQQQAQTLADLTQSNIFVYAHPPQQTHLPTYPQNQFPKVQFQSAAVILPASAAEVRKLLLNYPAYVGLYPTLTQATPLLQQEGVTQMKYRIEIPTPIPILNFKQNVRFQHHVEQNAIRSLILDAPIPYGLGKIEWFELAPQRTMVTITQWGDLNQPKSFLIRKVLEAVPDAKAGIPAATNGFLLESLRQRLGKQLPNNLQADQWPSLQLNSSQEAFLIKHIKQTGQPVSFMHAPSTVRYSHGAEPMRFATTFQYFARPVEKAKILLSPDIFKTLFPRQVKGIERKSLSESQELVHYKIGASLGVITIPFDLHMRYQQVDPLHIRYEAADSGDLRYIKGDMKLRQEDQGTLLTVTSASKVDANAPLLLRAARSLPFHDVLPGLTSNTIMAVKSKEILKN